MIRLMIVDDHIPTRERIAKELAGGGMIQVIASAETTDNALAVARQLLPDIVLLDLHLPGLLSTFDLLKRLVALPRVKVIIYAAGGKASAVQDLLDAGASGYVLKSDEAAVVAMTILMIWRGSRGVVSPALPRHLTRLTPSERALLRYLSKSRGKCYPLSPELTEAGVVQVSEQLAAKLELAGPEHLVKWAKKHGF